MKPLILVFFISKICNALETNNTEVHKINLNETNFNDLSLKIIEAVSNPIGTTEELISVVHHYFNAVQKLQIDMEHELQYTFDIFDRLQKSGGPLHCKDHLNGTDLILYFNWTSPNVLKFYRPIEATLITWNNIEEIAKELKEKYRKMNEITTPDGLGISQIEWQRREAKMDLRALKKKKAQEQKELRQARREERTRVRQEIEFAKQHNRLRKLQLRRAREKERLTRKVKGGKNNGL